MPQQEGSLTELGVAPHIPEALEQDPAGEGDPQGCEQSQLVPSQGRLNAEDGDQEGKRYERGGSRLTPGRPVR